MYTIDSHQHFWVYDPQKDHWIDDSMQLIRKDFLAADLKEIFDQNSVDGCIAVQADQSETETEFLLDLANANDFIKGVIGWVDLKAPNVKDRLEHYAKNAKFKGVRHIVQVESDGFMRDPNFKNGIAAVGELGLIYELLIVPHQLEEAVELVSEFPNQVFVIDHLAKPDIKNRTNTALWSKQMKTISSFNHVSCKLSGLVTEADWHQWKNEDFREFIQYAIDCFGTERLLFGSDWPVCLLSASYKEVMQIVKECTASLSKTEKEQIMGTNAKRIYNL